MRNIFCSTYSINWWGRVFACLAAAHFFALIVGCFAFRPIYDRASSEPYLSPTTRSPCEPSLFCEVDSDSRMFAASYSMLGITDRFVNIPWCIIQ